MFDLVPNAIGRLSKHETRFANDTDRASALGRA